MFSMFNRNFIKILVLLFVVLMLFTTAYAFAASNTVPTSNLGDGENLISGFTVSAVRYNLNASNPSTIDTTTFTISPALATGGKVTIQLVSSGSWYACTVTGGTSVSCNTAGASASTATNLRIVIAQ